MTIRWFIAPTSSSPDDVAAVDAVFLFAGGDGERLPAALDAVESSGADVLVLSNGNHPSWPEANRLCDGDGPTGVAIICRTPDPDSTVGEARLLGELASERGWSRVAIVSSTYHLERVSRLAGRCFDGELVAVGARPDVSLLNWTGRIVHEWAGLAHVTFVRRGC